MSSLMGNWAGFNGKNDNWSLVLADHVRVGPQPAVCWVLLHLVVSSAEELRCSWRRSPLWCWSFLQPADWTEWPCFPTPSASVWVPIKIKTCEQDCQILQHIFLVNVDTSLSNMIPGFPCETGPHLSACRARLCPDSSLSASPAQLVCPSQTALTDWKKKKKQIKLKKLWRQCLTGCSQTN